MIKIRQLTVNKFTKNILLSFLSVLIFLTSAELVCRLSYKPVKHIYSGVFEYDKDKAYRLKKNIKNGEFDGKSCETNSFGYRDCEIPVKKGKGCIRILAIGDSVTFGHGVLSEETYPQCLERLLNERTDNRHFDVINTAVPGNFPFQEYVDLKRGLVFEPDIVIIQFVANDVIEPYKVFKRYGGEGRDYHGVEDIPYWHFYLSEKSAFYLFLYNLSLKIKFRSATDRELRNKAMGMDTYYTGNAAATEPADRYMKEAWNECFKWLQREVDLCRRNGIDCILLISPTVFQFCDDTKTYAQKAVKGFAVRNGIEYIDILPLIREAARQQVIRRSVLDAQTQFSKLVAEHRREINASWGRYFLDYDHYSPEGHVFVAGILYPVVCKLLEKRRLKGGI